MLRYQSTLAFLALILLINVEGHGRLIEPPSRSSMWRFGFNTPINYNDNELFCGGQQHQWGQNDGKCGVCGDAWDGKREHEAGGKYATGTITRTYTLEQKIIIKIDLTANHKGYFEFRLCANNNVEVPVTQNCLDQHVLKLEDGTTRFPVTTALKGIYSVAVYLPADVTCEQCVIQWKYNTGNSWNCNSKRCCLGCGPQEQFYGCSDVAITSDSTTPTNTTSSTSKPASTTTKTTSSVTIAEGTATSATSTRTTSSAATSQTTTSEEPATSTDDIELDEDVSKCLSVGVWTGHPRVSAWCVVNCRRGFCPQDYCSKACLGLKTPY